MLTLVNNELSDVLVCVASMSTLLQLRVVSCPDPEGSGHETTVLGIYYSWMWDSLMLA